MAKRKNTRKPNSGTSTDIVDPRQAASQGGEHVVEVLEDSSVSLRRIDQTLDDIYDVMREGASVKPGENISLEMLDTSKDIQSTLSGISKQLKDMNDLTRRHDKEKEEARLEEPSASHISHQNQGHGGTPEDKRSILSMLKGFGAGSIGMMMKPFSLLGKLFGVFGDLGKMVTGPIGKMLTGGGSGLLGAAKKVFMFTNMLFSAFEGIVDFFDTTEISKKLGKSKEDVNILDRALNGIAGFVSRFFGNLIQPFLDWFGVDFNLEEFMNGGFAYIQRGMSDAVASLSKANPKEIASNLWSSLTDVTSRMVESIIKPVMDFFGVNINVGEAAKDVYDAVDKGITSMIDGISDKGLTGYLSNLWDDLVRGIKSEVESLVDGISNGVTSAINEVTYTVTDAFDSMLTWIKKQPWVPDWVVGSLPETNREKRAKAQLEYDRSIAKVETAKNELPDAEKEAKNVGESLSISLAALQSRYETQRKNMIINRADSGAMDKSYEDEKLEREAIIKHHDELYRSAIGRVEALKSDLETKLHVNPSTLDERTGMLKENAPPVTKASSVDGDVEKRLLDLIGNKESKGNYNALVYGSGSPKSADLVNMTIDQIYEYQSNMEAAGHASTAVGKYQIINGTLKEAVKGVGLKGSDKFSPENQDKLALYLLKKRGLEKFKAGTITKEKFANNLAYEWASLPTISGKSAYDGVAGNKAGTSYGTLISAIDGAGAAPALTPPSISSEVEGKGDVLVAKQREQSSVDVAVAQAPVQVQTINNVNQNSQEKISVALRNDEPSFRKVIERLAANSLGLAGSPVMVG